MKKVKVQRYVSGKRPEYAQSETSEEESDSDDFVDHKNAYRSRRHEEHYPAEEEIQEETVEQDVDDPRLRRLTARKHETEFIEERGERKRHIEEPEVE